MLQAGSWQSPDRQRGANAETAEFCTWLNQIVKMCVLTRKSLPRRIYADGCCRWVYTYVYTLLHARTHLHCFNCQQ